MDFKQKQRIRMGKEIINTVEKLLKEGKSYKEIAVVVGKTVQSIYHIKSQYLKHLGRQNQGMSNEKTRSKANCDFCGKLFNKSPSGIKKCEKNYCSLSCMGNDYRLHRTGKNSSAYKDGRSSNPNYGKNYRVSHRDEIRLKNIKRSGKMRKYNVIYSKTQTAKTSRMKSVVNYLKKNPDKHKAYYTVYNALKSGRIAKGPCKICGSTEDIHAHHEDYSKPLEVEWLCRGCHMLWHQLLTEWKHQEESGRWERQIKSYVGAQGK